MALSQAEIEFGKCPKGKIDCLVPGCGKEPLLRQDQDFAFYADALHEAVVLYDRNEPPTS